MRPGPNGAGLSRRAIMTEIDASLKRLGMDYVDLYQIHRWDSTTPIEETLEALHDVVKAGKVRYIGASSMYAWQFAKALAIAERHNWTRFVSMQNYYNLLYREEEREMHPLCEFEGVGVIPWSPLDRGRLARAWNTETERTGTDAIGKQRRDRAPAADRDVVEQVAKIAQQRGVPRASVALAWMLSKSVITAPIVGATRMAHLDEALLAVDIKLTAEEIAALEQPYVPHGARHTWSASGPESLPERRFVEAAQLARVQRTELAAQNVERGQPDAEVFAERALVERAGAAGQLDLAVQRLVGDAQQRAVRHAQAVSLRRQRAGLHVHGGSRATG